MTNRIIGIKRVKSLFSKNLKKDPNISISSITELNEFLMKLILQILEQANEYREARSLHYSKRLNYHDIKMAIEKLKLSI